MAHSEVQALVDDSDDFARSGVDISDDAVSGRQVERDCVSQDDVMRVQRQVLEIDLVLSHKNATENVLCTAQRFFSRDFRSRGCDRVWRRDEGRRVGRDLASLVQRDICDRVMHGDAVLFYA